MTMTIEEKAKRYDEALERMKSWVRGEHPECFTEAQKAAEFIFPELKESEDERIRRNIIAALKGEGYYDCDLTNECIAWVKKQGEHKPTDKVEPKDYNSIDPHFGKPAGKVEPNFKIEKDKWYVCTQTFVLRGKEVIIKGQTYQAEKDNVIKGEDGCLFVDRHDGKASDYLRSWTFQDAKDGDILWHSDSASNGIFIFKEIRHDGKVLCYCDYDSEDHFCLGEHHTCCWSDAKILHPATKEQRDTLFAKMKEAGYEWNAEKKVLKEIEHKPTIKVEPKFKVGDWISGYYRYYKVLSLNNDGYVVEDVDGDKINILFENEKFHHLFTIADAKDGDVLCCESGWTCIFKTLNSDNISFSSYCFMDNTGWFCETGSESHTLEKAFIKAYNGEIYPATKEQRDLLFAKMKEAGYEWNAEKKVLKEIEHKPTIKVEPKFNVGDWIIFNEYHNSVYQVEKIQGLQYYLRHYNDGSLSVPIYSPLIRQWTIADAKDGDVLYSLDSNRPFIFKYRNPNEQATAYCGINKFGKFFVWNTQDCIITLDKYVPATKEQRDQLEKAMADAGYTFNFEKKELKKLGQSEVTKTSDQEEIAEIPFGAKDSELQEATYFIPKGFHAEIDDDKVVIKKDEKPTAWSEEDEQITLSIEQVMNCASLLNIVPEKTDKIRTWLKSLKQRIGG